MDKAYDPKKVEDKIYKFWEENKYFEPKDRGSGEKFSIILPPPNANAPLHFGHAMYVIEDILIRYHRMKGDETLWLPGADHAGFETQFVFEKKLEKEGKSRFDFDRDTLYKMIWEFVQGNRPVMENQLRKLGFSLDWSRKKFTLDSDIIALVYKTFKRLYDEGLIFRGKRLVNYCTFDGTSFSDLEVLHKEKESDLYFIKYPYSEGQGSITVATTRPETILADVAVAVNPKDKRYKEIVGQKVIVPIVNRKVPIIEDQSVDMKFGTGALKITPGHDPNDFEIAQRHNLKGESVIGFDGKIKNGKYKGLYTSQARKIIVEDLEKEELIEKVEKITHQVPVCYKCQNVIEPLLMDQWFVKMESLAKPAMEAVKTKKIKIFPKRFEKTYLQFLDNIRDWNISRQIVWGVRIPAWFCGGAEKVSMKRMGFHEEVVPQVFDGKTKTYRLRDHGFKVGDKVLFENSQTRTLFGYGIITKSEETTAEKIDYRDKNHYKTYKSVNELIKAFKLRNPDKTVTPKSKAYLYAYEFHLFDKQDAKEGCGQIIISSQNPQSCPACKGTNLHQDTDTFDTWFSSSQWPFATLMTTKEGDFKKFYPTSVMETMYDILLFWVARMVMLGIYVTGNIPFRDVVLHGMVKDPLGKKMSKSKGNVVNPLELVDKYGADSVRFALVFGTAFGNDQTLSYEKLQGMRNFANKLWNIGRFIEMNRNQKPKIKNQKSHDNDKEMMKKVHTLSKEITALLEKYDFNHAAANLYDFIWHEFADIYIEDVKKRIDQNSFIILNSLFLILLKLLHPFMPFITEEIYQKLGGEGSIMIEKWPFDFAQGKPK